MFYIQTWSTLPLYFHILKKKHQTRLTKKTFVKQLITHTHTAFQDTQRGGFYRFGSRWWRSEVLWTSKDWDDVMVIFHGVDVTGYPQQNGWLVIRLGAFQHFNPWKRFGCMLVKCSKAPSRVPLWFWEQAFCPNLKMIPWFGGSSANLFVLYRHWAFSVRSSVQLASLGDGAQNSTTRSKLHDS